MSKFSDLIENPSKNSLLFCLSDPNSIRLGQVDDDNYVYFKLSADIPDEKLKEDLLGDLVDLQFLFHTIGKKKAFKHNRYGDDVVQEQVYAKTLMFSKQTNRAIFDMKKKLVSSEEELSGFDFDGGKNATFFELSEPALSL